MITTLTVPSLPSLTCLNASSASLNGYLCVINRFKSILPELSISTAVGYVCDKRTLDTILHSY